MSMASASRSMRIRHENKVLQESIMRAVNSLCSQPDCSVRVTTRTARFVLIRHETLIANGRTYSTQVRNVGAGVKELYLVPLS